MDTGNFGMEVALHTVLVVVTALGAKSLIGSDRDAALWAVTL